MAIVLPLPENLASILEAEKKMREQILVAIGTDEECRDHLKVLNESIDWIKKIGIDRKHKTDDELVVQGLISRIHNDLAVSLSLVLSGFYQASLMIARDIDESSLLLKMFSINTSAIQKWKNGKEYSPGEIRKFLEENEDEHSKGIAEGARVLYGYLSTLGIHPTWNGIKKMLMVDEGHFIYWGPFLDLNTVRFVLNVMASLSFTTCSNIIAVYQSLKSLDPSLENPFNRWMVSNVTIWLNKYGINRNVMNK